METEVPGVRGQSQFPKTHNFCLFYVCFKHRSEVGSLNKEGKSGQMAGGLHCPAPLPSPFTLVLEFSLGGLEGWALIWQPLSWEGSRAGKRKLYRNTVLGANT